MTTVPIEDISGRFFDLNRIKKSQVLRSTRVIENASSYESIKYVGTRAVSLLGLLLLGNTSIVLCPVNQGIFRQVSEDVSLIIPGTSFRAAWKRRCHSYDRLLLQVRLSRAALDKRGYSLVVRALGPVHYVCRSPVLA